MDSPHKGPVNWKAIIHVDEDPVIWPVHETSVALLINMD